MSSSRSVKFSEDEMVMAEDKGNIYSAKIVKVIQIEGSDVYQYFIHYQGWARKYDCWVQAEQICKQDDDEAKIRLQLYSESKNPKAPRAPKPKIAASVDNVEMAEEDNKPIIKKKGNAELEEEDRQVKRSRAVLSNQDLLQEDEADLATAQRLEMPMGLKKHLLDEWSLISQQDPRRLVKLPRKVTVEKILRDFVESLEGKLDEDQMEVHVDFFEGLQLYFEKALPTILLYRHEREQFDLVTEACVDHTPSQIYGVEHLLRLFVRLPKLMSGVFLPPSDVNKVFTKMSQFLKFLNKNSSKYLVIEDYVSEEEAMEIVPLAAGPVTRGLAVRR